MAMTHATFPGVVLAALVGVDLLLGSGLFGVLRRARGELAVHAAAQRLGRRGRRGALGRVRARGRAAVRAGRLQPRPLGVPGRLDRDRPDRRPGQDRAGAGRGRASRWSLVGKELVFGAFDRGGLVAAGYPAGRLDLLLLLLVELTVVISVPAVGTIQAVALIVAPAGDGPAVVRPDRADDRAGGAARHGQRRGRAGRLAGVRGGRRGRDRARRLRVLRAIRGGGAGGDGAARCRWEWADDGTEGDGRPGRPPRSARRWPAATASPAPRTCTPSCAAAATPSA